MHRDRFTLLIKILWLFSNHIWFASGNSLAPVELVSDALEILQDFEIASYQQEDDEDVVYLRKRAGEETECDTDCWTYSGWTWTDEDRNHFQKEEDGNPVEESDDPIAARGLNGSISIHSIAKRARKRKVKSTTKDPVKVCENTVVTKNKINKREDNPDEGKFGYKFPSYPTLSYLEAKQEYKPLVFDIADPTEPLDATWYELGLLENRWVSDVDDDNRKGDRQYAVEHILEAQLLKKFLEEDEAKGENEDPTKESRCAYYHKYFTTKVAKGTKVNLKVAKPEYQAKWKDFKSGSTVEYEMKEFEIMTEVEAKDWIAQQYPGYNKPGASNPTPWEYEFPILAQDINRKKEDLWAGSNLITEPALDSDGVMKQIEGNSETLEWLMKDKYYKDEFKTWENRKGQCAAVYRFASIMAVFSYHNNPLVKEVFKAQALRIADAFEYVETEVLKDTEWQGKKHEPRGLRGQWIAWIQAKHKVEITRLKNTLKDKAKVFNGKSETKTGISKRWSFNPLKRAVPKLRCGTEEDEDRMKKRVQLLLDAYEKLDLDSLDAELKL